MKKRLMLALAGVIIAAQTAVFLHLVFRWERIVRDGVVCRFPGVAFDLRDPFRGRYVPLQVEIRAVAGDETNSVSNTKNRGKMFARLEPASGTNRFARVAEIAVAPSGDGLWVGPREWVLDYRLDYTAMEPNETVGEFEKRRKASGPVWRMWLPGKLFVKETHAPGADPLVMWRNRTNELVAVCRVLDRQIVVTDLEVNGVPLAEALAGKGYPAKKAE